MPRPQRCRRICAMPQGKGFLPLEHPHSAGPPVEFGVDEYEAIRLLDLEGMTQEECAAQMEVSRTTVTGIYETARRKLAEALVQGRGLLVQGGSYRLCEEETPEGGCCRRGHRGQHGRCGCRSRENADWNKE